MLLPVDLQSKIFKNGINGYDKKDVDTFMTEIYADYDALYKDNHELVAKVEHLTEALNQYKDIEKSLQRALVLAQKASDDVKEQAKQQANLIEEEARYKAKMIVADANAQLDQIQSQTLTLLRQFEMYKAQYKQLVSTQLDILSGDSFNIDMTRFSNLTLPVSQEDENQPLENSNLSTPNHPEKSEIDTENNIIKETELETTAPGATDSENSSISMSPVDSKDSVNKDNLLDPITRHTPHIPKEDSNNSESSFNVNATSDSSGSEKPKERGYYDVLSEIYGDKNTD